MADHFQHLDTIVDRLQKHELTLKWKKCNFLESETNRLCFIIGKEGIKPDPKKMEAIRPLLIPTFVREVRLFIGMSSYYCRFIPNCSEIAEPFVALTKKHAHYKRSEKHNQAFTI